MTLKAHPTIDLNSADEEVLINKLQISARLARRILVLRPYQSVDQLENVWGIEPETLQRIKPLLSVSGAGQALAAEDTKGSPLPIPPPVLAKPAARRKVKQAAAETEQLTEENLPMGIRMHKNVSIIIFLSIAFILHISWMLYTRYIHEDAFITFRFAQNLSNGLGFVYNAKEPVYGTTTPFFTIIMALWSWVFPNFMSLGASMMGLFAGLVSIFLFWKSLDTLQINKPASILAIGMLTLSDKIWYHDTAGMETSLVICAMLASYYMLIRNKPVWAGLFSGILLWIRIDGIFWFCVLVFAAWYIRRQLPRNFIGVAILTYLPWLVFASIYFGSPIPHTIQAKWVEYYILGLPSVTDRILVILNWLTPFYLHSIPPYLILWIAAVFTLFACIGAIAYRHYKWLLILPVFCLEELIRLVVMGETYESRYYFPLFWALTILAGLGIHTVWAFLARQFKLKPIIGYSIIIGYCCICMWFSLQTAQLMQREQYYKNDLSLKELGIWLEKNTPTSSTVYLEPLGYVGFYANRYMIDQVGLINPQVVDLRKKGASMFDLIATFNPDYAVLHCDDALRSPEPFLTKYSKVFETNPLHFDPYHPLDYNPDSSYLAYSDIIIQRIACYQIWKR